MLTWVTVEPMHVSRLWRYPVNRSAKRSSPKLSSPTMVLPAIAWSTSGQRCIVTTIDPDTGAQDIDVLLRIREQFATRIALN